MDTRFAQLGEPSSIRALVLWAHPEIGVEGHEAVENAGIVPLIHFIVS
jgi:hypothetical protein